MKEIELCNLCGKCNSVCPVFALTKKETHSNRHKAFLIMKDKETRNVFKMLTDSSAKRVCPASIDLDKCLISHRHRLVQKHIEIEPCKEMIDNLRRYGNPLGRLRSKKKIKPYFC